MTAKRWLLSLPIALLVGCGTTTEPPVTFYDEPVLGTMIRAPLFASADSLSVRSNGHETTAFPVRVVFDSSLTDSVQITCYGTASISGHRPALDAYVQGTSTFEIITLSAFATLNVPKAQELFLDSAIVALPPGRRMTMVPDTW